MTLRPFIQKKALEWGVGSISSSKEPLTLEPSIWVYHDASFPSQHSLSRGSVCSLLLKLRRLFSKSCCAIDALFLPLFVFVFLFYIPLTYLFYNGTAYLLSPFTHPHHAQPPLLATSTMFAVSMSLFFDLWRWFVWLVLDSTYRVIHKVFVFLFLTWFT